VNDLIPSGHSLISSFTELKVDQSFPVILMALIMIGFIPLLSLLGPIIQKIKPGLFGVGF